MEKFLESLLKYFSLIIAIPPIFGAIWQLIELSKMSLSYIRFFSVSQLIPDGILTLVVILLFFLWIIYTPKEIFSEEINTENKEITTTYFDVKKPKKYLGILFIIISFLIMGVWYEKITNFFLDNINQSFSFFLAVPLNFLIFVLIFYLEIISIENLKPYSEKKILEPLRYFLFSILGFFTMSVVLKYYSEFNKQMLFPNNLVNIKKVENDIKTKYPNTTVKLKYLNDKYIFYSITDKKKNEKIKIVKFDNLFEE
ncbi:hypothetical protein B0I03_10566 [Flavobacterium aquaticum]|uniref:Uncharacterized protein n=1 Tax=Flavobacterium aquaticum TaxID=1236486 RepID=A0A327YKS7_9FLAO|nr:hypothetical protein [Flavobacterium aquaticum]RAK21634.1 hypothetical protein B0I03_10566 [Flavobacterium aquaticum]